MLRWARRAVVLVLPACFHPIYDRPACGSHSECPSGFTCSAEHICESGSSANPPDGGGVLPDGGIVDLSPICPSIALGTPQFLAAACATPIRGSVRITANTAFDTNLGTSTPDNALSCVRVSTGNPSIGNNDVCVLAATSIVVEAGVVLSAHGSIPFALFARSLTIQGTVDVASHRGGPSGAGSLLAGCLPGSLPTGGGGGRGGDAIDRGGRGGDDGSTAMSGASGGGTFTFNNLSNGGCGGTQGAMGGAAGSDGGLVTGGAGGGAVWVVSLSSTLILDAGAKINASGSGGAGGKDPGRGGSGGGAGGLILLQAPSIQLTPGAAVFANGGHGGGGAGAHAEQAGFTGGADGSDPTDPTSGGLGGTGGLDGNGGTGTPAGGTGGPGYPSTIRNGQNGTSVGHGGGGGGGGPGAIRVVSTTDITGPNVSPPPVLLQ